VIDYSDIKIGDKVRVVGMGAPGYAQLGDVLEIVNVSHNRVDTRKHDGAEAYFALTCGASRLEKISAGDNGEGGQ